jgi:fermentation-respiration switch protein FrsA (DUF1100 family)
MLKILAIAAGAYLLLVGFVYLTQSSLLYLPELAGRQLVATPDGIGLDYDEVWLDTSDGVRIHGWFVPGDSTVTLLYFHGNAGNISHRLHTIRQFHDLDLSVFIIDYRGYGDSEGRPSERGLYRDAEAAWEYLTETRAIPAGDIVVLGRSLGGSLAAWLAAERNPRALIVDSAFTSVPDIGQDVYPWLPVRLLSRIQHPTREHVTRASCPVLVVHSRDDEIIPFHHAEALFSAANEPKTFLELRGGHNDTHFTSEKAYIDGLCRFLQSTEETRDSPQASEHQRPSAIL